MVVAAPFSPPPVVQQPTFPADLIDGGPLAVMHRALAERLQRAFPLPQFQHRITPARFTPDEFGRFTERCPVIGLGWVRMDPVKADNVRPRIWSGRGQWAVFLVVKNQRVDGQLLGDKQGVGLMGMIAVATAALHGWSVAGIGSAEVGEGGQVYHEGFARADLAQASLTVTVPFDLVDAAALARLDDFLRMGERWPGLPDQVIDIRDDGVTTE